jgi:hypothetical protein
MAEKADTDSSIEIARLEIERERLKIEQAKLQVENRFWNKNTGTVITAAVSLVAIIVSLGQVWVAKITKDKELQVTSLQKKLEMELLDKQKEKELALAEEQRKREWNLRAAKFVTENRNAIFGGNSNEQELFAKLIPTIYPKEISDSLLDKLIAVSSPRTKRTWQKQRFHVEQPQFIEPLHLSPPPVMKIEPRVFEGINFKQG